MAYVDGAVINQEAGPLLHFDAPLETGDIFWASPERMEYWAQRINNLELTTMALGTVSYEEAHGELATGLFELLEVSDPLHQDVMRTGMMYGSLLASDSLQRAAMPVRRFAFEADVTPLSSVKQTLQDSNFVGLWTKRDGSSNRLSNEDDTILFDKINPSFMMLREIEVSNLGSDILATTLGVVQDHVSNQVYNRLETDEEMARVGMAKDAQVLFYAGALSGALKRYLDEGMLPNSPTTQLYRGASALETVASVVTEFEPTDAVDEIVTHALESQYGFYTGQSDKSRYIGVFPNGIQFGPNSFQLPVPGLQMPWQEIDYKYIRNILMTKVDTDKHTYDYRLAAGDNELWEYLHSSRGTREWHVGALVIGKHTVISRLALTHPHAQGIDEFISEQTNVKPGKLRYPTNLNGVEITGLPRAAKNLKKVAVAGAMGPWAFELIDRYCFGNGNIPATIGTSIVGAALGVGAWGVGRAFETTTTSFSYGELDTQS